MFVFPRGQSGAGLVCACAVAFTALAIAQTQKPDPAVLLNPPKPPGTVERLSDGSFRVGTLRVDTSRREVTAPATINDVTILEWIANTRNGSKAYESLLTIDTDAVSFNAALLLIGLDPARSRVPTQHFDPEPPEGDPVELLIEARQPSLQQMPIEELLFDQRSNATMTPGPWVYTGSAFVDGPAGRAYLAELDGVLIGFVHSPAPVIENPRPGAVNAYGAVVLNSKAGLPPGTAVALIIRALPRQNQQRR